MCVSKRNPWLSGLGVVLAVLVVYGGHARADVTTDQAGSIIIFPKVISDGIRDTLIEISNTQNMPATAHCIYVNASGVCSVTSAQPCKLDSDCPISGGLQETCVRQCLEDNFDITLTGQQPTFWIVSAGRPANVFPGFTPGNVPARGTTFEGELKCFQTETNGSGSPYNGNALIGKARLTNVTGIPLFGSVVSEYNAVTIQSNQSLNGDNDLNIGSEYNACPSALVMNHYAAGATDAFLGSNVNTELTLVPCSEDLEDQVPTPASALALIVNELEGPALSVPIQFDCWFNRSLTDIPQPHLFQSPQPFDLVDVKTPFAKTRIRPTSGNVCYTGSRRGRTCTTIDNDPTTGCPGFQTSPSGTQMGCRPWTGLIGLIEEFHALPNVGGPLPTVGNDAVGLFMEGSRPGDVIVAPTTIP